MFRKEHTPWNKNIKINRDKYPEMGNLYKRAQITYICTYCEKEFESFKSSKRKFCSRECWRNWFKEHHPMKNIESRKRVSESKKGITTVKGETHGNWQGGKSFEPYPLGWTNTFKEQIRYRDGYKCQICGVSEVENCKKLSVHHIDYNKNNIIPDNLISLCVSCHMRTNGNREYWKVKLNGGLKI